MATVPIPQGSTLEPIQAQSVPIPQGATIEPVNGKRTWLDSATDFAREAWNQVNPVEGVKGLAQAANHPIDTGKQLLQSQGEVADKAEAAFKQGNYAEGVRHVIDYLIPVLGPQIDRAGDLMGQGQYAKGMGATAGLAANIAAPELIKGGLPGVPGATPLAEKMYQSALKPSTARYSGEQVQNMVRTGIDQEIPVSKAGADKLSGLISDLQSKVQAKISSNPNAPVNKFAVASRLGDTAKQFETQVNPESDLKAVSQSGNEFLRNQPSNIPASAAQNLKTGTYQQIKAKNYGELASAAEESQKALARGLKEELEVHFPEIRAVNAMEGQAINLDGALERAVKRIDNRDVFSLGGKIAGSGAGLAAAVGSGGSATHTLGAAAAGTLMHYVLTDPAVQSRLAMMVNAAGKGGLAAGAARARVVGYSNALGNAVTAASSQQSNQE